MSTEMNFFLFLLIDLIHFFAWFCYCLVNFRYWKFAGLFFEVLESDAVAL